MAINKRTTEKLVELKELAGMAGKNVFRRIKLADEVLSDKDWIAASFDGQEDKALAIVENEYFTDFRGFITVGEMRQVYRWCGIESRWAEYASRPESQCDAM